MPATHDEAFLEDICAHPDDDATRLIYADWLDDRGDAARAEFIRVQVERRKKSAEDGHYQDLLTREEALIQENEAGWRAELPALDGVNWEGFYGGFVEAVFVNSVEVFLRHAAVLFAVAPIVEPVGVDEPGGVVVGMGADVLEKGFVVRRRHESVLRMGGRILSEPTRRREGAHESRCACKAGGGSR